MTGLLVLTFVPLLVALGFLIRARAERDRRSAAERELAAAQSRLQRLEAAAPAAGWEGREWLTVLAHELRTPAAAILGYEELLEEGTLGEMEPRALDALQRIRLAVRHLCGLLDGLDRLHPDYASQEPPQKVPAAEVIGRAIAATRSDAEARRTTLEEGAGETALATRVDEAHRALVLALGAAIKNSPGATLRIDARDGEPPCITIAGATLDPRRDDPDADAPTSLSGVALRLALARHTIAAADGMLRLLPEDAGCTIRLDLPRLI